MEIRIDERLVDVFNEVVEKDARYFDGETNLEKALNAHLADFLRFIDEDNNQGFLSVETKEKLLDFFIENIKDDEIRRRMKSLAEALLKKVANK